MKKLMDIAKIFENSYSLQRANLGEHFLTTLQ